MARKRRLSIDVPEEREPPPPAPAVPGWREWLRGTYAKYWYVLGCFFLDMVVFFEAARLGLGGWAVPFLLLVLLVGAQTLLYLRIWPWRRGEGELDEEGFL